MSAPDFTNDELLAVQRFGFDRLPLSQGTRVRATVLAELIEPGALGTITWTHPWTDFPYRVEWDGHAIKDGEVYFGMSDIGWLTRPQEIEPVDSEAAAPLPSIAKSTSEVTKEG